MFGCVWGAFGSAAAQDQKSTNRASSCNLARETCQGASGGCLGVWGVFGYGWGAFGCVWGCPGGKKARIVLPRAIWHVKLARVRLGRVWVCLGRVWVRRSHGVTSKLIAFELSSLINNDGQIVN